MYIHWTIVGICMSYASLPMPMYELWSLSPAVYQNAIANPRYPQIMPNTVDLLTTTETKDQVESRLLLDVVIAQCTAILQLLTSKDQSLLVRWDTLLVLNL